MSSKRICIITTGKKGYSETFIKNQIKHLPFQKKVLYGGLTSIMYDWETEQPIYNQKLYKLQKLLTSKLLPHSEKYLVEQYLSKYLIKHKIDVVLAEFGPVGSNVCKACQKAGIPLVVHFHGDDAHSKTFLKKYDNYQELVRHASAVICVSKTMQLALLEMGFDEQKLKLIPYGIDTAFFSKGSPKNSSLSFLATGRFVDKKAPHLLILSFSQLLKHFPSAQLHMIGTGPLLNSCKALVKALNIEKSINFKGICSQEEVQKCLKDSRAFLMHSVTPETGEKEGTPLSILEASASGLPIVSTFHAGISEAVIHEKTGFLTEEYDIESMTKYMIKLAKKPELAQAFGEEGQKHISSHYNLHQQINKLASVIEQEAQNNI